MLPTAAAFALLFAPGAEPDVKQVEFFESKIRPVLIEQCYGCHSAEAKEKKKLKGGLYLDTKAAVLKGGDTGPAVLPGKPADSLLLKSMRYDGDVHMPPKGKLPDAVLKDFETWIAGGAVDPRTDTAAKVGAIDIEKGKQFWSFQPIKEPPVRREAKASAIDQFIAAKWQEQKLTPVGPADKRTLLRRVYLDLIGLPPTAGQVEAFEKDNSPGAFATIVDNLLASPQHGETWARHWLDVARYAEDQAHTFGVRPKNQAWRYRDWVIKAFNDDMPYDRFVRMQLAADLLPDAPTDAFEKYAGLGFLGLGAEYYRDAGCGPRADADELDDKVDTLTRGFLGLTVACARCHDHKFDPIPTKDYYSLAGVYVGTKLTDANLAPAAEVKAHADAQAKVKEAEGKVNKAKEEQKKLAKEKKDDKEAMEKVKELVAEVEKLKKAVPPAPAVAHVLSGNGPGMKVMVRGNPTVFGEDAPKGFLQVLPSAVKSGKEFDRLALANAIASQDNPLTARVIVNRVWAWHFGRGIVGTPSNFGTLGELPSNQPLLDWLAFHFVKNGWSLKWLHRQIVLSAVYQLDSRPDEANDKIDAANVYLWRANRRRVDVEQWRDSLLFVSGTLDPKQGGPTFSLRDPNATRRTVYAKVSRHEPDGLLRLFDFPDANVTADKRVVTTVPQQQLFALNSPFMVTQAKAFAGRAEKLGTTDAEKIVAAYRLAFGRMPETQEFDLAERFLKLPPKKDDKLTRWQQFAQVLLASNELMYVD
jgi:hypothetical protein